MADVGASDVNGDPLAVGDVCTMKVKVIGSAGGIGSVKVQILNPSTLVSRTGGAQTDVIPVMDANLLDKV